MTRPSCLTPTICAFHLGFSLEGNGNLKTSTEGPGSLATPWVPFFEPLLWEKRHVVARGQPNPHLAPHPDLRKLLKDQFCGNAMENQVGAFIRRRWACSSSPISLKAAKQ